jgi:glucans biosynthesis protein C
MNRRHDIDALRALAFALVILYHVAMYYVADWHWHLKSPHAAEWLTWPMSALNLWRMDLVFLISGVALGFLRRGQANLTIFRQRSLRLLVPLTFGMAVIVPFQPYAQALAQGLVTPGFGDFLLRYYTGGPWPRGAFDGWESGVTWNHLWYLPYLWLYTTVLLVAAPLLDGPRGLRLRAAFVGLRGARLLFLPAIPLVAYAVFLRPLFPATHDLIHDAWLHALYFTLFLYGYWIGVDEGFWGEATRLRHASLWLAISLFAALVVLAEWNPLDEAVGPRPWLRCIGTVYLWAAIVAILGWAHLKLNRPWPWLAWANESVYPWYVLHQTVIIVLIFWLAPLNLGPVLEPALLVAGTVAGCWSLTALVRRSDTLRPLFGLRRRAPSRYPSPTTSARPSAHSA